MAHEHLKPCEHTVKYCATCDVAYCEACNKEWKSSTRAIDQYWREYMNPRNEIKLTDAVGATIPSSFSAADIPLTKQATTGHAEHY